MTDLRGPLEREGRRFELPPGALERLHRRHRRRLAAQRVAAGTIAAIVAGAGIWVASMGFRAGELRQPAARAVIHVGGRPGPVAFGFGSVWVGDSQQRLVSRIDPRTGTVASTIQLPRRFGVPTQIVTSRDRVWVQTGELATAPPVAPAVVAIDPRTDSIDLRRSLGPGGHVDIAVAFGSIWSANRETGEILRRDASTGRVVARLQGQRSALMLAAGARAVWVLSKGPFDADPSAPGTVARIDPRENEITATVAVGVRPVALAAGADSVWVVNAGSRSVTRIDGSTGVVAATIPVPGAPTTVAVGPDTVWAGSPDGRLWVIDPAANDVVATVEVAPGIGDLARGVGGVWATAPDDGTVVRVR